jgi:DNA polymerase-3 subunit beta
MTTHAQAPETAPARFTTTHRELSDALKTVALGVAAKPPVPILGGVMAETSDGALTLRAFDYETSVSVRVDGGTGGDGASLFNFYDAKDVLAAAVAGEKTAVAARTRVTVDDGTLSTPDLAVPLNTLPLEEYPAFPPDAPGQVTVNGAEWFARVARVLPAAAGRDDMLPALTYVHLRIAGGVLRLTATDRYRVTVGEVEAIDGGRAETAALVPAWLLEKMSRLLGRHTGPVTVGVMDDWVTFTVGAVTVTVRCPVAAGDFPDLWGMLPSGALPLAVRVDREALTRAVRKAHALSKAKGLKAPHVLLEFAPAGVTVSPGLDDGVQDRVRGVAVGGEALAGGSLDAPMVVNGAYLLDALGTFNGPAVVVHARTSLKPFVLTDGEAVTGEGFVHMLMPVRLKR